MKLESGLPTKQKNYFHFEWSHIFINFITSNLIDCYDETMKHNDGTMRLADGTMIYNDGTIVYNDGTKVYNDGTMR